MLSYEMLYFRQFVLTTFMVDKGDYYVLNHAGVDLGFQHPDLKFLKVADNVISPVGESCATVYTAKKNDYRKQREPLPSLPNSNIVNDPRPSWPHPGSGEGKQYYAARKRLFIASHNLTDRKGTSTDLYPF